MDSKEARLKRIEEMRKKNKELEKENRRRLEIKDAEDTIDKAIKDGTVNDPTQTRNIVNEALEKEKKENERIKQKIKELNEKMNKYKGDFLKEFYDEEKNFTYLADIKDFSAHESQCDIIAGDPKALAMENIQVKKKNGKKKRKLQITTTIII